MSCCDGGYIHSDDGSVAICATHHSPQSRKLKPVPTYHPTEAAQGDFSPLFTWRGAVVDSDLQPVSRHVALTLSLHMNERGGSCFPAYKTLSEETGLDRTTVIRHIEKLIEKGWLTKEKRPAGRGHKNTYTARVPQ